MTHEVVPGDIELATRLLKAGCQDSGIIAELCWRGVGGKEAAELVEALRQGQKVRVTLATGPSHRVQRRNRDPAPADPNWPQAERVRRKRSHRAGRDLGGNPGDFISVALFLAVVLGLIYLFTADVGVIPGRETPGGPFIQTDDFSKGAKALTNSAAQ